jgi:hypothetical protein
VYQRILKEFNSFSARNPFGVGLLNGILMQGCLLSYCNGGIIHYGFEVIQWKIAWSLELQLWSASNQFAQLSYVKNLQAPLLADCSGFYSPTNGGYLPSDMACTETILSLGSVSVWSFCSVEFCQDKLWDPGIWALLCVLDFSPKLRHDGNLYPLANFDMVTYLHCRGPRATDESDCLAPMQLFVSRASRC